MKAFFYYTLLLFIFNLIAILLLELLNKPVMYFMAGRIFNILEYITITYFLSCILRNKLVGKIILFTIIPFAAYAIIDYAMGRKDIFNNHSHVLSSFLFLLFIIYYLFEKMQNVSSVPLYQTSVFWICTGLMLYFAGTFFFFIFINIPKRIDLSLIKTMSQVYMGSVVLKNIILCLSLFASQEADDDNNLLQIPKDLKLDEPFIPTTAKN